MKEIQLSDTEVTELTKYYEQELKKIDERRIVILKLMYKLQGKNQSNGQLSISPYKGKDILTGYDKNATWFDKCTFFLEDRKAVMRTSQFKDLIIEYEPDLSKEQQEQVGRSIAATLSRKVKEGKLKDHKPDGVAYYGLSSWFDENGLKEEYRSK